MSYSNPMHHADGAKAPVEFSRATMESARMRWTLRRILDVKPSDTAGNHDLWLAIGEIRKLAKHGLA